MDERNDKNKIDDASQSAGRPSSVNNKQGTSWNQSSGTSGDSDYIPPARTGASGDWEKQLGGQGEMIDSHAFPGQESDREYLDTGAASASNTGDHGGYSDGGHADDPATESKLRTAAGRDDMTGDGSSREYQENQDTPRRSSAQF